MSRIGMAVVLIGLGLVAVVPATRTAGQPGGGAAMKGGERVGAVDIVRIFDECRQINELNNRVKQQRDEFEVERKKRAEALDNRRKALEAFKFGSPDWQSRRKELMKMTIEANAWAEMTQAELESQSVEYTREVYQNALVAIEEVAKTNSIDLVLHFTPATPEKMQNQDLQGVKQFIKDRTVMYHTPQTDITDLVLARLDANYAAQLAAPAAGTGAAGAGGPKTP